ncbi:MAG: sugar phosphate nucleotidyltransferase, partial [Candidatus Hydrogenedentales bacterium]
MAVVTADPPIGPPERFREAVELALETAENEELLVTHGIVPDRPETGYGYIQAADLENPLAKRDGLQVFRVKAFHEKPNRDKAYDFVSSGDYYWNSGMFFWRLDVFLRELETAREAMAGAVHTMVTAINGNDKGTVNRTFEELDNISIDYALMEHAKHVAVVRADYSWDDVGAWTSLDRTRDHDAQGNVVHGQPVLMDCRDCIVFNDAGSDTMAVTVVGVEDMVVVVSADGVLVIPKDRAQDVRLAVAELKARGARQV